jgi:hypothetical protein
MTVLGIDKTSAVRNPGWRRFSNLPCGVGHGAEIAWLEIEGGEGESVGTGHGTIDWWRISALGVQFPSRNNTELQE